MDPVKGLLTATVTDETRLQIIADLESVVTMMRADAKAAKFHARNDIVDLLLPIMSKLGYTSDSSYLAMVKNDSVAEILSPGRTLLCVMTGQSIIDQLRNQIDGPGEQNLYTDNRSIATNIDRFVQIVIKS